MRLGYRRLIGLVRLDSSSKRENYTRRGGSQMFSLRKISLKKLALAISLVAMLGVASCGVHVGGHIGGHHAGAGVDVDK